MRIHIITNLFAPDELAGAALFTDLALFLKERGHDVRVTCTFSYYPAWQLRAEDRGVSTREEVYKDVPVRRVAMHIPKRPTGRGRMLSELSFLAALTLRGKHPRWQPDIVLTALPMLAQCLAQRFLYPGKRIPRLIVVQDFVVEASQELGLLQVPGLGGFFHGAQRWALRSAQTLVTISPAMLEKLRCVAGADRRVRFVPNWIHHSLQETINSLAQDAPPRQAGRLFYSGNIGVKQGLPDFLSQFRAAVANHSDWRLEIHGGGAELERLRTKVAQTPACSLKPVLQEASYIRALLTSSACLVTQRPGVGANFMPSKILPALATGTPVLAVCDRQSPLGHEVEEGGFGEVVAPGDAKALAAVLRRWKDHSGCLDALAEKARERAALYHRACILPQYEEELAQLCGERAQFSTAI